MDTNLLIQLVVNGLIVGALYGVVAMCFVLVYKASQVVNFAQGEFLLIGAWTCWCAAHASTSSRSTSAFLCHPGVHDGLRAASCKWWCCAG